MSSQTVRVPSLVGGVPTKADFAPSIIFAVAYGLSVIPFVRRFLNKDSRTWTLALGTLPFSIERVVVYAIRASQSHDHNLGDTISKGKLVYQQVSFALGFVSFASDAVAFVRATMVNTTLEDPNRGSVDQPDKRRLYRRCSELAGWMWLAATVPGIVAYTKMPGSGDHQDQADQLYRLRYASSATALFFFVTYLAVLLTIRRRIQWLDRRAIDWVCFILVGSCIVPIYRLAVLHYTTSFLNVLPSTPPLYPTDSLTTTASKATFYIFHALPELILAWTIQTLNLRAVFNTGPFGDWRGSDKKYGIVQLREKGVYVDGVGVPKQVEEKQNDGATAQGEQKKSTSFGIFKKLGRKDSDGSDATTTRPSETADSNADLVRAV
ncbi:hypothetical protein FS837_009909 [Tulasnella sp. UAMH 9824]|nr:hypothetical protein FS837_009909 [Tulasnella sp. UAMH 9824]